MKTIKIKINIYSPKELWVKFWNRFFWPRRKQCAEWVTREEQIIQASDEWTYQMPPQYSELVHKTRKVMCAYQVGFIDGAVWADEHPRCISVKDELPEACVAKEQEQGQQKQIEL